MSGVSYDPHSPMFLGAKRTLSDAAGGSGAATEPGSIVLIGVGYDGTTSFRPGTRFGPDAIRVASGGLESYSPILDRDLDDVSVVDRGNLEISFGAPGPVVEATRAAVAAELAAGNTTMVLGGEHSISSGAVAAVAAVHPDLLVVQFDAHADLRADYLGEPHNHACAMRRCLDVDGVALLQVGIRSGTRAEFVEMREDGRLVAPTPAALEAALARHPDRPIYLTIDLDVFDPAVMPGTGTPEPGGIDWPTFSALLGVLDSRRIVAGDVMELAPNLDASGCSAVLAAKVTREIMLVLETPTVR